MTATEPEPQATRQQDTASGPDLARTALAAARLAARKRGTTPARRTPPRTGSNPARGDGGREPLSFAAVFTALMEARGWQAPAAGGTLADRWPDIAPELAGHVHVHSLDATTGVLELVPSSPAYATQLRLHSTSLITRINTALHDGQLVRSIRILAPGHGHTVQPPPAGPVATPAEAGPVHTRDDACDGYRQALAAHQAAHTRQDDQLPPAVRAAVQRQAAALHELSRRAFPETDDAPAPITAPREQRRRQDDAIRTAALRRARAEKAGRQTVPRPLERTA